MKKGDDELSYATVKKNIHKFKIVFIGDQYVGKSSIINRFIKNEFDESHNATIGIDFVSKNLKIGDHIVRLQLWDTAGQQRFRSLIPNYLKDSQVAFIVFDITNLQTYEAIPRWIDFIKQFRGQDVLIFVIGNKLDLVQQKKIDSQACLQKYKQLGIYYYQVSAKSGQNLQNTFKQACQILLNLPAQPNRNMKLVQSNTQTTQINKQFGILKQQQNQVLKKSKLQKPKEIDSRRVKQKNCC